MQIAFSLCLGGEYYCIVSFIFIIVTVTSDIEEVLCKGFTLSYIRENEMFVSSN